MKNNGIKYVVMEVSAHALFYDKVEGIKYDVGVFTNLTQDHLDFFNNLVEYGNAKLKLFEKNRCKFIVTNIDDDFGKKIAEKYNNVFTYGINNPSDIISIFKIGLDVINAGWIKKLPLLLEIVRIADNKLLFYYKYFW